MNETRVLVKTIGLVGIEPHLKTLEIHITPGSFTKLDIVGIHDNLRREMRVRVVAALQTRGLSLEGHGVTVVSSRTEGTDVPDLAIAVGLLAAFGNIPLASLEKTIFIGELSLAGRLHAVRGLSAMLTPEILPEGWQVMVPYDNAAEAGLRPKGTHVFLVHDLGEVCQQLNGGVSRWAPMGELEQPETLSDLSELELGSGIGRRALEVAAAGGHNMLLIGPPGAGKTMLARRLTAILPKPSIEEVLEWIRIHSVAGLVTGTPKRSRPFRAPHHTVSDAGLLGGGTPARPGEVSLAHQGVLFLDEVTEFRRSTLEALGQPLSDEEVVIAQSKTIIRFPAKALVVAAMNPTPCGYAQSDERCHCSEERIAVHFKRIAAPLDRFIDLRVPLQMPPIGPTKNDGETSLTVRARVEAARNRQLERQKSGRVSVATNGRLSAQEAESLAGGLSQSPSLLRVALTLADLEGADIATQHILEATLLTLSRVKRSENHTTTKGQ
jgi:magnesium chelatase family protein